MSTTDRFLYSGVSWATNAMTSSAAGDPARVPPSHRRHPPGRDLQRALAQRPGTAVALTQVAGLDDVHRSPPSLQSGVFAAYCPWVPAPLSAAAGVHWFIRKS